MFFLMLGLTFFDHGIYGHITLGCIGVNLREFEEFEPGKCLTSTVEISRRIEYGIGIHDAVPEAIRTHANYHRVSMSFHHGK